MIIIEKNSLIIDSIALYHLLLLAQKKRIP